MPGKEDDAEGEEVWEPPDYGSIGFWENHFTSAPHGLPSEPHALEYEWIVSDLDALVRLIHPHLPIGGRILHPGCGMSLLPIRLHELGLDVLSVDSSPSCIAAMQKEYGGGSHSVGLAWQMGDVRELGDVAAMELAGAVEKGCLDALLCESESNAALYIAELARILPVKSPLLLVSNSPARHRHLSPAFTVKEVLQISPSDVFGPSIFICERAE